MCKELGNLLVRMVALVIKTLKATMLGNLIFYSLRHAFVRSFELLSFLFIKYVKSSSSQFWFYYYCCCCCCYCSYCRVQEVASSILAMPPSTFYHFYVIIFFFFRMRALFSSYSVGLFLLSWSLVTCCFILSLGSCGDSCNRTWQRKTKVLFYSRSNCFL